MSYPSSWKVRKLGSIVDVRDGTHDSPKYVEKGVPFITSKNLKGNSICFDNVSYISKKDHADFSRRSGVESGDILFGMIGTIGNTAIVNTNSEFSIKNVALLKLANNQEVLTGFIFYILNSSVIKKQFSRLSNSGVQSFVSLSMVRGLDIPFPPIKEQERITKVLSTADKKIDLIEQKTSETQQLKKGLIQKLFTEGVGEVDETGKLLPHTEFQDSPFGLIPATWSVITLGECVSKIGSGVTPKGGSKAYVDEGVPLIRSQNILVGKLKLDDVAHITEAQHSKMKGSQLEPSDVLLNITGASIGRCAVLPEDFENGNVNQHVCIIRMDHTILPEFCGFFLNSQFGQKQIWSLQAGGNREGLNFQQIRSFLIPRIPIKEQQKIVEILTKVDEKIDLLNQQKAEAQQLKKGLMQKLLTGEWRVPLDDQAA